MEIISEEMKKVWDITIQFEDDERERLLAIAERDMPKEELEDAMLNWVVKESLVRLIEQDIRENEEQE